MADNTAKFTTMYAGTDFPDLICLAGRGACDGSKPVYYFGAGSAGMTAVKKGSAERVQEMLHVLNWLAAPFDSQQDLLLRYGLEGIDYKLDNRGNPIPTDRGAAPPGERAISRCPAPATRRSAPAPSPSTCARRARPSPTGRRSWRWT